MRKERERRIERKRSEQWTEKEHEKKNGDIRKEQAHRHGVLSGRGDFKSVGRK